MNNKPKIHGYCAAGCAWETVHKSDFDASASHIKQYPDENGIYSLLIGKEYKIFPSDIDNQGFNNLTIKFAYLIGSNTNYYTIKHTNDDAYANYVVFRLVDVSFNEDRSIMQIVYELAGVRYMDTVNEPDLSVISTDYLTVEGASDVLMYNADATIKAEKGEKGDKGDNGKDATVDETLSVSGAAADAKVTGDRINSLDGNVQKNTNNIQVLFAGLQQKNIFAKAELENNQELRQTANGEATVIDGSISTVKKIQGSTVRYNGLVPYPYAYGERTVCDITYSPNEDGSVVVNGKHSGVVAVSQYSLFKNNADPLRLPPGTYTITSNHATIGFQANVRRSDGTTSYPKNSTFELAEGDVIDEILLQIEWQDTNTYTNTVIYPVFVKGSTALPWQPYFTGLKSAKISGIKSTGRNLFDISKITGSSTNFWNNGDGTLTVQTYGAWSYTTLGEACPTLKVGDLIKLSIKDNGKATRTIYLDIAKVTLQQNNPQPVTQEMLDSTMVFYGISGTNDSNRQPVLIEEIQILRSRIGGQVDPIPEYEPYTESVMQLPEPTELLLADSVESGNVVRQTYQETLNFTNKTLIKASGNWVRDGWFCAYNEVLSKKAPEHSNDFVCDNFDKGYWEWIGKTFTANERYCLCGNASRVFFCIVPNSLIGVSQDDTDEVKLAALKQWLIDNPPTVAYKTAEPISTEPITFTPEYTVYDKGSEQMLLEDKAAIPTVTNEYLILGGAE